MLMLKNRKTFKMTYPVLYLFQLAVVWLWLSSEYYANRLINFFFRKNAQKKSEGKKR